jgi:hypothetical protein
MLRGDHQQTEKKRVAQYSAEQSFPGPDHQPFGEPIREMV